MPPKIHSNLGPSSAHRWLLCTPSVMREADLPDETSVNAEEGTLAHALVEVKLNRIIAGKRRGTATAAQKKDPLYNKAMEDHTDSYCDTVEELLATARRACPDAMLASEMSVSYDRWVPGGHGTTDTVIIADGECYVIDFKYGRHVVEALDNPQLRLYALGVYEAFSALYTFENLHLYIIQPRADGITSEDLTVDALLRWAEDYVKPRAEMALKGAGEAVPGEKQCRYCKARFQCPERMRYATELMQYEFKEPELLTDAQLADIYPKAERLTSWVNDVKDFMTRRAISGYEYPGMKLVRGRSIRKIVDETKAEALLEDDYGTSIYRLKSLTDLEDIVGKKQLAERLGDLIVKPEGKLTLVMTDDKRQAVSVAETMFND